jgi:hypothetical protein
MEANDEVEVLYQHGTDKLPSSVTSELDKLFGAFKKLTISHQLANAQMVKALADLSLINGGRIPKGLKQYKEPSGPEQIDLKLVETLSHDIRLATTMTYHQARRQLHMDFWQRPQSLTCSLQPIAKHISPRK